MSPLPLRLGLLALLGLPAGGCVVQTTPKDTSSSPDTDDDSGDTGDTGDTGGDTGEDTGDTGSDTGDSGDTGDTDPPDPDTGDTGDTGTSIDGLTYLDSLCVDGADGGDYGAREVDLGFLMADFLADHPYVQITTEAGWAAFAREAGADPAIMPVDFDDEQLVIVSYTAFSTCGVSEVSYRTFSFGFAGQPYVDWVLDDTSLGCDVSCDMYAQLIRAVALPLSSDPQVCVTVTGGCLE